MILLYKMFSFISEKKNRPYISNPRFYLRNILNPWEIIDFYEYFLFMNL